MGNRVELDEMGKRILDASRTDLYLSMRFLGPALHSLGFIMDLSTTTVGTDAAYIRFNPNHLFRLYVDRPRRLNRTYLHMILHCVFRHMFTAREKEDRELWDLASDIAVDAIIDSMEYRAVAELTPEYRQKWYSRLEEEIHVLTAERIYQYFIERKRNYLEEMQLAQIFETTLDDLTSDSCSRFGMQAPPKGKHLFGLVTVGDKGQIVIPAKARKLFDISAGDQLVVLGDETQGLAVMKADHFLELADLVRKMETLE